MQEGLVQGTLHQQWLLTWEQNSGMLPSELIQAILSGQSIDMCLHRL